MKLSSFHRLAAGALLPLFLLGCQSHRIAAQNARDEAALRREFADLFVAQPPIPDKPRRQPFFTGPSAGLEECRLVLAAVREARVEKKADFDRITNLEIDSATKAWVGITWSGGFHGGTLALEKTDGKWHLTQGFYAF